MAITVGLVMVVMVAAAMEGVVAGMGVVVIEIHRQIRSLLKYPASAERVVRADGCGPAG
jgi:hypothetical protein